MASQNARPRLNWIRPGKEEVSVVGSYVAEQAPKIHIGFGGSSELKVEQVKFVVPNSEPYIQLEHALRDYITELLGTQTTTFDHDLCDRIAAMEKAYGKSKEGFWYRLWYGIGNAKDIAEAWLDLIPNEYGVSVIKAGMAVVFKLADNSREKREKVFNTFRTLQEALVDLHPDRARFRDDSGVKQAVDDLYKSIVKGIEDMVLVLSSTRSRSLFTTFAAKLKRENETDESRPTLDEVLQSAEKHIQEYKEAVGLARDHTTERTEVYSRMTAARSILIHQDMAHLREDASHLKRMAAKDAAARKEQRRRDEKHQVDVLKALREGGKQLNVIAEEQIKIQERQSENQALLRTMLLQSILESKALQAEVAGLRRKVSNSSRHTAVVSLSRLCQILAQPGPLSACASYLDDLPDLERMFQHPSTDLLHATAEQSRCALETQGQVQSLLTQPQFRDWLSQSRPSLVLVDANLEESSLDRLSAISVFSSTLVTSLMQAYPETAVVTHFFCGLHSSLNDTWYGPSGLVRSLIVQLLTKLDASDPDMETWNLDFINDREFLQNLEEHSLTDLGLVLHKLLYQFPLDTHVYCIVDSISCFDVRRVHRDLDTVLERFRIMVNDTKLRAVFKVLLTNPGRSTRAITSMNFLQEDPTRLVTLSRYNLVPGEISERAVGDYLPAAGRRTPSRSPFGYSRRPSPAVSVRNRSPEPVLAGPGVAPDDGGYGDGVDDWNAMY